MTRHECLAEVRMGHKGPAIVYPFDPAAMWPGRRRHFVRGELNGRAFEGEIGLRRGVFYTVVPDDLLAAAGVVPDATVHVAVEPREPSAEEAKAKPGLASARLVVPDTATGTFRVGTSGFAYDAWKGVFYPPGLKTKDRLRFYAGRFSSTEINYTFRRLPSAKTLAAWVDETPDGFVFALKAHQFITHARRLVDPETTLSRFLEAIAPLAPRLGPILFQCPETLAFEKARLAAFLAALPDGLRCVFEFRHPSWEAAKALLASHGAAWCVTETDDDEAPDDALASGPFHYLRLRRVTYSPARLAKWAGRIGDALDAGRDVYCYFQHEDEGKGPTYAARLEKLVTGRARAGGGKISRKP